MFAAQLPGRGARLNEAPIARLPTLIELILPALRALFDKPFAFFGHSLGALVGFELARELRRQGLPAPARLLVSACTAPHLHNPNPPIHPLLDEEFAEALRRLNGTPDGLLENRELMTLRMPALRADLALRETYVYSDEPPLACPIDAFGGMTDPLVSRERLEAWREVTAGSFSLHVFPGDHFYLNSARDALLDVVARRLGESGDGA